MLNRVKTLHSLEGFKSLERVVPGTAMLNLSEPQLVQVINSHEETDSKLDELYLDEGWAQETEASDLGMFGFEAGVSDHLVTTKFGRFGEIED